MTIIEKKAGADGFHRVQSQSHRRTNWMGEGWVEVPPYLEQAVRDCGGYAGLILEDGVLVGIDPIERPENPGEPTAADDLTALAVDHEYRITLLELGINGGEV